VRGVQSSLTYTPKSARMEADNRREVIVSVNLTGLEQLSSALVIAVVVWSASWVIGKTIDALSRRR
jgi:hypothetical protein